jgi:hypothetical protein
MKKWTRIPDEQADQVCDRLFNVMTHRAVRNAEETYRRMVFENEMAPERAEQFRPAVVARMVERQLEYWVDRLRDGRSRT